MRRQVVAAGIIRIALGVGLLFFPPHRPGFAKWAPGTFDFLTFGGLP
jgi:hypothetical protein